MPNDDYELIATEGRNSPGGFLQLMRLPNIFTAMADVAMGFLFVKEKLDFAQLGTLGMLLASSCSLYVGGVVLNDVVDRELDAAERPSRPLPSGRVTLKAAAMLSGVLLLAGVAFGLAAAVGAGEQRPGVVAGMLLGCILLYNLALKNTLLGPVAMGGCRMLNVLLGMSVAGTFAAEHWLVSGGIGLYIAGVTWFARTEARQSNRLPLAAALAVMALGIAIIASLPYWYRGIWTVLRDEPGHWYALMAVIGAMIGWRCVLAIVNPSPILVQRAVGYSVLLLIMLDGAACYVVHGPLYALAIWGLIFPALLLGRRISPT
jgi:4-hydroxybenzoate polyprenyltransferase